MYKIFLKAKVTIVFMIIAVVAGSCCTLVYCSGADDINYIRFNNFPNSDLDTITIQKFNKNNNFATVMEDILVITTNFSEGSNYQEIQLPLRLTIDYDYKIKLNSTGEHFTISDFVSRKASCNTGFMCNDSYNTLESYVVNGELKHYYPLNISK